MSLTVIYDDARKAAAGRATLVSPTRPGRCCGTRMERVGGLQDDGGRRFYYRRCGRCGFTVRHFLPVEEGKQVERLPRRRGPDLLMAATAPRRRREADVAPAPGRVQTSFRALRAE